MSNIYNIMQFNNALESRKYSFWTGYFNIHSNSRN
nr:MAG TPA: hypothetical protein [Caudoviricetes sp.]